MSHEFGRLFSDNNVLSFVVFFLKQQQKHILKNASNQSSFLFVYIHYVMLFILP